MGTFADRLKTLPAVIDRAVAIVSPQAAYRREMFRRALSLSASYYDSSRASRLTNNWATGQESADTTLDSERQTIVDRARDLNRNNPIASGITDTICNNVVSGGIRPQSVIDHEAIGITEDQAATFQRQAEAAWNRWLPFAMASEMGTFYEGQALAMRQILESGESLSIRRALPDRRRPYMLALDMIEGDRLDDPAGRPVTDDIRFGVEKGPYGQPLAYYISSIHPGDNWAYARGFGSSIRVPKYDSRGRQQVFHVFKTLRPGQTRGVPAFASVMPQFKILHDYIEAELVAARISACFAAFVKTDYAYGAALNRAADTNSDGQRLEGMEPGMVEYLGPGQDIVFSKPERPGGTFDSFVERIMRVIGASQGLPYELVLRDFSKTNYSSARAALLQAYRIFGAMQQMLINGLCQPAWELLLEEAYYRGELAAPGFEQKQYEYTRAMWVPPGWPWVDPLKEANANTVMVDSGFASKSDICATMGKDWELVALQKAREKKRYEELGITNEEKPEAQDAGRDSDDGEGGKGQDDADK